MKDKKLRLNQIQQPAVDFISLFLQMYITAYCYGITEKYFKIE